MSNVDPSHVFMARPRPISRRGWVVMAVVLPLVALAYTLIVAFYDAEGGSTFTGGAGANAVPGILVTIEPVSVDALTGQATVHYTFIAQGSEIAGTNGALIADTRIVISNANGIDEVKFEAGEPLGQFETVIGIDGEQAYYPFDVHFGEIEIAADTFTRQSDGSLVSVRDIAVGVQSMGGVNGWNTSVELSDGMTTSASAGLTFMRSFSTQLFALLILLLVVVLSTITLVMGILVRTSRRRAEAGLLSWVASMLFALPLLRNYMPNSPPIGVSIDIVVYVWVIVMAVIAAVLIVTGWMNQNRQELEAQLAAHEAQETEVSNAT